MYCAVDRVRGWEAPVVRGRDSESKKHEPMSTGNILSANDNIPAKSNSAVQIVHDKTGRALALEDWTRWALIDLRKGNRLSSKVNG